MRCCHSIWTLPLCSAGKLNLFRVEANLWLFALSVAFIKRLNATIVLHTDNLGKQLFGFLPYNEVYLSLNSLSKTPVCFWAAGKLQAQLAEPLGSIHIDGDVFLKSPLLLNKLDFVDADLLVQSEERRCNLYSSHLQVFNTVFRPPNLPKEFSNERFEAYNCGVVGFNNDELKLKYIEGYNFFMNLCVKNAAFVEQISSYKHFVPDLILEQWWLHTLSSYYSSKVQLVFNSLELMQEEAVRIGFVHLVGNKKYEMIPQLKARLLEVDSNLYWQTEEQCAKLLSGQLLQGFGC